VAVWTLRRIEPWLNPILSFGTCTSDTMIEASAHQSEHSYRRNKEREWDQISSDVTHTSKYVCSPSLRQNLSFPLFCSWTIISFGHLVVCVFMEFLAVRCSWCDFARQTQNLIRASQNSNGAAPDYNGALTTAEQIIREEILARLLTDKGWPWPGLLMQSAIESKDMNKAKRTLYY